MKTYVIVGLGGRSIMFKEAIAARFKDSSELLAICDNNCGRLEDSREELSSMGFEVECYHSDDFDRMIAEQKPATVIVCTKDSTHDDYICRALDAGCDVITEKPMTIDAKRCQRIVDAIGRTGKSVRVTFNYRYSPPRSQVKELLMSGVIGKILSVNFNWYLDTNHGADYFRRWHRSKANSGGLMVHKSTHHFDLVNWWLSSVPETVFAGGARSFYNEEQAKRYGLEKHGQRCLDCPVNNKCNFYLDMKSVETIKELYLDNEQYDGYIRDCCVFSDDIDIEDTMNLVVKYKSGAFLSYSLNAFTAWEGYRVEFNGTKGRLEHSCHESSYINGDGTVQGALKPDATSIKVYPHFKTPYNVEVRQGDGAHGGGDVVMLNDIFGTPEADPLKRSADYIQGAYSILTGIAANKSMATNQMIIVDELVYGLPDPGYPAMHTGDEKIDFVSNVEHMIGNRKINANIPARLVEINKKQNRKKSLGKLSTIEK
ncbi:MAG: Gfo/Idh/MocA family oxidoreductase [Anaerohalosphaeraceae bacterium]|nr:Gfo/Idh/MocA family oxidoreductase [Anaerohalosphaeraceae bacterium]